MHYFSIHTQAGEHLGFLIMLADDESAAQPQSGRFAVKLQSEDSPRDKAALSALQALEQPEFPLYWRVEKDQVGLYFDDTLVGSIRNEYLTISGQVLVLNDLTGTM